MNIRQLAETIARADAAMCRAGIEERRRGVALEDLGRQLVAAEFGMPEAPRQAQEAPCAA